MLPRAANRRMLWLYAVCPPAKEGLMRIAVIATLILASAPLVSIGQNAAPLSVQQKLAPRVEPQLCPLDMHVRQGSGGGLVATDKERHSAAPHALAARLRLLLNQRPDFKDSRHLVKARVRVRGLGDSAKLLPSVKTPDGGPDLAMTVTIPLTAGSNPDFSGDLVLPGFTAALSVELKSVTLDSGEVLSFKDRACQVAPDLLIPINH
jgi:hypothetical protein